MSTFLQIDLPAASTAAFAALACALLGNFLVLRRESLLGDAVSHAVLPGIVIGFLVVGSRASLPMMVGAALAGLVAVVLIRLLRDLGRIEPGASMGAVFTAMFALGVLLLETGAARAVDIDADCVLYGQLEDILWLNLARPSDLLTATGWAGAPRELVTVAGAFALTALAVALFWKELKLVAFDPAHAAAFGLPVRLVEYAIAGFVALAAVSAFEAVGSILVIALLICPAATARLLTDRYGMQIGLSTALGGASAVAGYALAVAPSVVFGAPWTLNAAGTIAAVSGLVLTGALVFGRHGVLAGMAQARHST